MDFFGNRIPYHYNRSFKEFYDLAARNWDIKAKTGHVVLERPHCLSLTLWAAPSSSRLTLSLPAFYYHPLQLQTYIHLSSVREAVQEWNFILACLGGRANHAPLALSPKLLTNAQTLCRERVNGDPGVNQKFQTSPEWERF